MKTTYDFGAEAELTNAQLAGELAKLTPLTEEQLNTLLPRKTDKLHLQELIDIVNSSASQNRKLADLTDNFADLGGVVLKVLTQYLKPV
jgi:hypothetical protein